MSINEPGLMSTHISLSYGRKPMRVLVDETGLWLPASDLFALLRRTTDRRALSRFSPEHLALKTFESPSGPQRLTAVSPLGAVTIAKLAGPPVDRMLDLWSRRHLNDLATQHGLPALSLTLLADNTLPVKPRTSHSDYMPWHELKWASGSARRNPPNPLAPALFDEDPVLGAYVPPAATDAPSLDDGLRRTAPAIDYTVPPERAAEVAELLARMGIHHLPTNTQP
ncbi:hypothetical protein ACYZX9_03670 [Sphingomonas citri]